MASHKGWDRQFPVTSVAKDGGSFRLAKGQLGLINMDAPATTMGLKVIDSLDGLSKDTQFQLRVGKHPVANNRSQSSKDWSTLTFRIGDVINLDVDAPSKDFSVDEFILGYNGFDDDSAIVLGNGDNEEISLTLCGEPMGLLGYKAATYDAKVYLTAPNEGVVNMHEIIEKAVEQFNNYKLIGDVPLSDYVEAVAVNSENTALTDNNKVFYQLVLEDAGNSNALAEVQSQYNAIVKRTNREGNESTYTILGDLGAEVATTNFVAGQYYIIKTVGDTDFTAIGASANAVNTIFKATGVGGGTTGVAYGVDYADFVKNKAWKIKGCANCPDGYSEFADGWIYSVALEDDGADSTATVEGISVNAEGGSAVKVNVEGGTTTYTVIISKELTEAEIAAFVASNESAVIELVSKDVKAICSPDNLVTSVWTIESLCHAQTEEYSIIVSDDECGVSKQADLDARYPDLTITQDSQANCQTKFTTNVTTNVVCDECSDQFRALFVTEPPVDFEGKSWVKTAKVYSATAKMGIKFKAKKTILSGTEEYRDDMPFVATSVRLKLAGGYITEYSESFFTGRTGRMAVSILSIGTEPENWGGNLREFEDITRRYQEGPGRHEGNNYGKYILGEETLLDGTSPYVDYILTIEKSGFAQSFGTKKTETMYYHFLVQPGKHKEVEDLLNELANEAGIKPVQAYAND